MDFEIEMDYLIPARRRDVELIKKEKKKRKREFVIKWILLFQQTIKRK